MTAIAIEVPFFRRKKGKADAFASEPFPDRTARPLRVAKMLALAHHMRALLEGNNIADQRELADLMGLTRARVTQLLGLTLLAPDIQEQILVAVTSRGSDSITERSLRALVKQPNWDSQRRLWRTQATSTLLA